MNVIKNLITIIAGTGLLVATQSSFGMQPQDPFKVALVASATVAGTVGTIYLVKKMMEPTPIDHAREIASAYNRLNQVEATVRDITAAYQPLISNPLVQQLAGYAGAATSADTPPAYPSLYPSLDTNLVAQLDAGLRDQITLTGNGGSSALVARFPYVAFANKLEEDLRSLQNHEQALRTAGERLTENNLKLASQRLDLELQNQTTPPSPFPDEYAQALARNSNAFQGLSYTMALLQEMHKRVPHLQEFGTQQVRYEQVQTDHERQRTEQQHQETERQSQQLIANLAQSVARFQGRIEAVERTTGNLTNRAANLERGVERTREAFNTLKEVTQNTHAIHYPACKAGCTERLNQVSFDDICSIL